jgi:putative ABC transport system permease protein
VLVEVGLSSKQAFPFSAGVSLILVGVALLLRWIMGTLHVPDRVRDRIGYTLAGLLLVAFWVLPFDALQSVGVPQLQAGIEMFFLSGMMLVLGAVWAVMYNADLLLGGLLLVFGGIGQLAPILKAAVTYPMQQKMRTGMTLAMFSLIIFTLMVMSVLTRSTSSSLDLARDLGGYQAWGTTSPLNPVQDMAAQIAAQPALRARVAAVGGLAPVPVSWRQPGQKDQSWQPYAANVADDAYLAGTRFTLHSRAAGFTSDQQVWQTLRTHTGYAVVDASLVPQKNASSFGGGGRTLQGFYYDDKSFRAVPITLRDSRTGALIPLRVIGVLDQTAGALSQVTAGIYTSQASLAAAHDAPAAPTTFLFRVAPGQSVHQVALALGAAFLTNGLDMKEAQVEYAKAQDLNAGLNNLLLGFMALGLVVGIAALGVIAARMVVERRQQIGVLRAIGFKRRMVQASFLLESSFVALLGTLLGVVLGLVLARNLVESLAKSDPSVQLVVPWGQIGIIVALAYLASLLTTYLPARQAAHIYPAEALRFE